MWMPSHHRLQIAQDIYRSFAAGDRDYAERTYTDDFTFSSPLDVGPDRNGFFERCWPDAGQRTAFEFVRLIASSAAARAVWTP